MKPKVYFICIEYISMNDNAMHKVESSKYGAWLQSYD